MKSILLKMILVITMIMSVGVQGYAQRYYHHHRPLYLPTLPIYSYGYGYGGYERTYVTGADGITRRVYVEPSTVVVERPVYRTTTRTTTTTSTTKTKSTSFEGDKVKVERLSGRLFRVKGEKSESVLTTENANFRVIATKLGSVTIQTTGKDDVISVKVLHGDKVVQQSQL